MNNAFRYASTVVVFTMLAGCNSSTDEKSSQPLEKERKSLLVMIDGARYEAVLNATTPNLDKLAIQQAYTGGISDTLSQSGTSTVEGESTLWTGSWHTVQKSGENGFKTVWQHLITDQPEFTIGLYPNWPIFDYVNFDLSVIENKKAFRTGTNIDAEHDNARIIADKILSGDYDSLFTTIDMVDYSGHCYYGNSGGAWSDDYVKTIEEADQVFGYMMDAVLAREAEYNEEWLVMVAPDHGFNRQKDNGSVDCAHGSQDIDAKKIWVASNQAEQLNQQFTSPLNSIGNRDKDGIYRYVAQTDVTPTLLTWHNVDIKPDWAIEGTPLIGEIGVRGLFVENIQDANTVEITFTASNNLPVQVFANGSEIVQIDNASTGDIYTFEYELDNLEPGSHQITFTLVNNAIPKSITTAVTILDDVDYDDLPFGSISALYSFDDELTDNSIAGGHALSKTGEPSIASTAGKYENALYHVRNFNNDLLFDDLVTNTDKFTISLWFIGDGTSYDPAILTNKRWASAADGMILAQLNASLKLQVGVDGEGSCCFVQLPYTPTTSMDNLQWNLLVASVDKTKAWSNGEGFGVMTFGVYNAKGNLQYGSVDLTGDRKNTIHTGLPWLINNDHAQTYNTGHAVMMDELIVWDNVTFTPGEVVALGSAAQSVTDKLSLASGRSNMASKSFSTVVEYLGANPNLSEQEKQSEAFWQRRRQMEELKAELAN
ncbi:hypothetical protein [Photobacterium minamisatsumaniensis]|uniref:hypothetical protein n=1 Tax=Photobacterium minamisatsumaniensis TaxID=2910233 RepID=UPI003D1071DB